ncbi:hypothetical protein [Chryseobacterium viscerum]|uniref:Uncharacterized protein n=1 Tax=Chryseobacterium viscerum TaxID=1037377 RepID=A0A316WBR5_9FLAO|nr:hypothetical protein [Chryseobacterium viscerum]PWN58439.1 hypothetical protein C1634_023085 [Chryseobacterium viscerum]
MRISNLRKESSERSDDFNWAKKGLLASENFYFESIEGCNQNNVNVVTHILERARVDIDTTLDQNTEDVYNLIINLEGEDHILRKVNFANCFSANLNYVLYCDESETVLLYEFTSPNKLTHLNTFNSYSEFSHWIASIKGWKSSKAYRESPDLPNFDKKLRAAGTAWPTNIDCFFCDLENNPIGIIEFQNAKNTGVLEHCNNDYLLCKMSYLNQWGYTNYHDDIRRWTSQEILRVQSDLRFIIITWSQNSNDFQIKELEKVSIPFFPLKNGKMDWDYQNRYKAVMNKYVNQNKPENLHNEISKNGKTYNLIKEDNRIVQTVNEPPLSYGNKTFPSLYYVRKEKVSNNREVLLQYFNNIVR